MVRRITPKGTPYHEPPYTPEEEADRYRRVGRGPVTIVRGSRRAMKSGLPTEGIYV